MNEIVFLHCDNVVTINIANNLVQTEQNVYLVVSSDGQPLTGVAFVFNGEFNEPAIGNATAIDFQP